MDIFPSSLFEGVGEMLLCFGLAVNEEEPAEFRLALASYVTHHLVIVAVAREGLDAAQVAAYGVGATEYGDGLIASHNLGT